MPPVNFTVEPSQHFFALTPHAFDRRSLHDLLPNYHIVTTHDEPGALGLLPAGATSSNLSTKKMLALPRFRALIYEHVAQGHSCFVLVYKNDASIAKAVADLPVTLLAPTPEERWKLENKAKVRERLAHVLPFPPHSSIDVSALATPASDFKRWHELYGSFVIQDEQMSAGKGTFFVHNNNEYESAVAQLQRHPLHRVVISRYLAGEVASIQLCFTQYGTFTSPIQEQLFARPELTHRASGVEKFCGGQWSCRSYSPSIQSQIATITRTLEQELTGKWRGILGVDVLITPDEQVYVLEINARLTGLSAPLALLQRHVSSTNFLLLHVLELANIPYRLTNPDQLRDQWQNLPTASYLVPHNRLDQPVKPRHILKPGIYQVTPPTCTFDREGLELHTTDEVVMPDLIHPQEISSPGMRLPRLFSLSRAVDQEGHLTPHTQAALSHVEASFAPLT